MPRLPGEQRGAPYLHSKVRYLLDDGDGQLVPHVRVQTGEQLLHNLAGQGADNHLNDFTGHHRWRILILTISLPDLRRFISFLIQLDSDREEETPVGRVLMGQIWLMEMLRML